MTTYCGIHPPKIQDTVQKVGYRKTVSPYSPEPGAMNPYRWEPYDASPQYFRTRFCSSVKTPGFKRLKTKDLPMNPFYAYTGVVTDSVGSITNVSGGLIQRQTGFGRKVMAYSDIAAFDAYEQFADTDSTPLRVESRQRALKSMSNMKFNAAQAFAERRQTANLLIRSVNRFVTVALAFRKGRWSEVDRVLSGREGQNRYTFNVFSEKTHPALEFAARKHGHKSRDLIRPPNFDSFSNLWLEFSYGWRPLLYDIYGAAELIAQTNLDARPMRAVGTVKKHRRFYGFAGGSGITATAIGDVEEKAKTVIYFDVTSQMKDTLKSTGISNPALLAWELLPYSFVVDWFIPVGRYLENLNATSGLTFLKGATSYRASYEARATSTSDGSSYILSNDFLVTEKFEQLFRETFSTFPGVELPSFSLDLNLSQVTSGLSLLQQAFFSQSKGSRVFR